MYYSVRLVGCVGDLLSDGVIFDSAFARYLGMELYF